jgi:hypothetical protein
VAYYTTPKPDFRALNHYMNELSILIRVRALNILIRGWEKFGKIKK